MISPWNVELKDVGQLVFDASVGRSFFSTLILTELLESYLVDANPSRASHFELVVVDTHGNKATWSY